MKPTQKQSLMKELGANYQLEGNNIVDRNVQGYSSSRNFAQVREANGRIYVNKYKGYWYKSGEEKGFDTVRDAVNYLLGKNNG